MTLIWFPQMFQSASREALLYVFEDNEAVIKMIMKGRSPTMRHVSRTHRVALDWLFDRINLDPKIQIKYIDTKNQLADILTKETIIVENIFSAGRRILQGTKRLFTIERGNPLQRISKERLILKSSSWEVRQQNLSIKSGTKCEFDRKECQAMQRIVPNIR